MFLKCNASNDNLISDLISRSVGNNCVSNLENVLSDFLNLSSGQIIMNDSSALFPDINISNNSLFFKTKNINLSSPVSNNQEFSLQKMTSVGNYDVFTLNIMYSDSSGNLNTLNGYNFYIVNYNDPTLGVFIKYFIIQNSKYYILIYNNKMLFYPINNSNNCSLVTLFGAYNGFISNGSIWATNILNGLNNNFFQTDEFLVQMKSNNFKIFISQNYIKLSIEVLGQQINLQSQDSKNIISNKVAFDSTGVFLIS